MSARRHADPQLTLRQASEMLQSEIDPARAGYLHWIHGLPLHELDQTDAAVEQYRAAIECAQSGDCPDLEARSRANLAISLLQLGRSGEAKRSVEAAHARAPLSAAGHVQFLVGLMEQRAGRHHEALASYELSPLGP